jgi:hypothetical protein
MGACNIRLATLQVVSDWREAESVKRWFSRLEPATLPSYYMFLRRFLRRLGKDPDTAILWARESPDKFIVLDEIQQFILEEMQGGRFKSKLTGYTALRSFFSHNRIVLPKDPGFRIRGDSPPTERKITINVARH